ncbi:adenylate kinase family protein [Kitasatospora sp. NPDC004240]
MRLVLLQPPAWPLDGPADSLARALAVPRISFGDLLRAQVRRGTELGVRLFKIMDSGGPFPDEVITAIVRDHLCREAPAAFLLDGHPLSAVQVLALDELLHELGTPLDGVLRLRLPEQEVERRIRDQAARRLCRRDAAHRYEPSVDTLVVSGVCDICGGELYQRKDDEETNVRGRFRSYEARVEPITRHYADQDLLVTVDAAGTPEEITVRALTALRRRGH